MQNELIPTLGGESTEAQKPLSFKQFMQGLILGLGEVCKHYFTNTDEPPKPKRKKRRATTVHVKRKRNGDIIVKVKTRRK